MAVTTFRELIDLVYVPRGESVYSAKWVIHRATKPFGGVSMDTLRRAYNGTRIEPESADRLVQWCTRAHPEHQSLVVSFLSLVHAPRATPLVIDYGERARRAIEAAVAEMGTQPNSVAVYYDIGRGRWSAFDPSSNVTGGPKETLSEALNALADRMPEQGV